MGTRLKSLFFTTNFLNTSCLCILFTGCWTPVKDQGDYRKRYPVTTSIGFNSAELNIKYDYNISSKIAFSGEAFGTFTPKKYMIKQGSSTKSIMFNLTEDTLDTQDRVFNEKNLGIKTGVRYFPFKKSGFYLGTSLSTIRYQTSHLEHKINYDIDEEQTNIEYSDTESYLHGDVGFAIYMKEGKSVLSFALSPRQRLSSSRILIDDGADDDVNTNELEETFESLDKERQHTLGYRVYFGIYL